MSFVLIVANSARMAAQAACELGLKPLVIDLYADLDTQDFAHAYCQVPSLSSAHLKPAIAQFIQDYPVKFAIYGSGFEFYPDSLYELDSQLNLLGNSPETFQRVQDKVEFFAVLGELELPHPEVSFSPPESSEGWLIKPLQGLGGMGIRHYREGQSETGVYWQKHQAGTAGSVLFLADGKAAEVIGFNTQWTLALDSESFIFSGIINSSPLTSAQEKRVAVWLEKLVLALGLCGLNSLDFICQGDDIYILEINPRLPASMQLYGKDLLLRHCQAKLGTMDTANKTDSFYTGYQVVYALQDLIIPATIWPEFAQDLPPPKTSCRKNQPICSIIARHASIAGVHAQLSIFQQQIFNQLNLGSPLWNTAQASTNCQPL